MRDDDVEAGRLTAAGGIYPRCAHRPVHGWLSGAGGLGDMSSSVPIEWLCVCRGVCCRGFSPILVAWLWLLWLLLLMLWALK